MKTYRQENGMHETELPDIVKLFVNCNKNNKDMEAHVNDPKVQNNRTHGLDKENYRED